MSSEKNTFFESTNKVPKDGASSFGYVFESDNESVETIFIIFLDNIPFPRLSALTVGKCAFLGG